MRERDRANEATEKEPSRATPLTGFYWDKVTLRIYGCAGAVENNPKCPKPRFSMHLIIRYLCVTGWISSGATGMLVWVQPVTENTSGAKAANPHRNKPSQPPGFSVQLVAFPQLLGVIAVSPKPLKSFWPGLAPLKPIAPRSRGERFGFGGSKPGRWRRKRWPCERCRDSGSSGFTGESCAAHESLQSSPKAPRVAEKDVPVLGGRCALTLALRAVLPSTRN